MFKFVGTIFLAAAATAAAFFVAEPARAATAVLQPHAILLDGVDQASSDKVIAVGGGFGGWHGGWHGGGWHGGGWHGGWGHRRWYGPGWGYAGWGAPWVYGGYYGGPCGYGFRWTYRWGCVPIYGY
jgi:hypothetical protein